MTRLNRLILLSFLGMMGAATLSAQEQLVSLRVQLSDPDAIFLVDGQQFRFTQNFVWPVGSTHLVSFPMSQREADTEPYQYSSSGKSRYAFGGWSWTQTSVPALNFVPPVTTGTSVWITAQAGLTEILGTVSKQFPLDVEFFHTSIADGCSPTVEVNGIDRQGVAYIDGNCIARDSSLWITPGVHTIIVYPYPGFYLSVFNMGNGPCPPTLCPTALTTDGRELRASAFNLVINSSMNLGIGFSRTKRVRFATDPPGLEVLVDRVPVVPFSEGLTNVDEFNDYCGFAHVPVKTPAGVWPLCNGDFDFIPGSSHQLGVREVQRDPTGGNWVFQGFSNGMGQNGTLIAGTDTYVRDVIEAKFIRGVISQVDTNVAGLRIVIDGKDVPPSPHYGFIWAEGSTHHLSPPPLQRDTKGRMWKFVSWSDGGEPEHDVTVPVGADSFAVTAFFEVLGQIKLTSNVPGLHLTVDGAECEVPCVVDKDAGAGLAFSAPENVSYGEASRYQFNGWGGLPEGVAQTATFNTDVQTFNVHYHGAHRLLAHSDPDGSATITFSPESADGFYAEGTPVQITVKANTGYKFLRWEEDLSGKQMTETLHIVGPSQVVARMLKSDEPVPATVRNAAGETPDGSVAPGSIISIYGENLTSELVLGPTNPLAQSIGDTVVTVNDRVLPLFFVSPTQINAQVLSTFSDGEYTLKVQTSGRPEVTGKFTIRRNAPGVFFNLTESGMPLLAALHQDGTPVTEQSPALRGETISFYGTGLGFYDRPTIDGFVLPNSEVYNLVDPVKVVAGVPQSGAAAPANAAQIPAVTRDPAFAGGAAGMVGTSLVKITLDNDLPQSNVLELSVTVNGTESNKVQIPVR